MRKSRVTEIASDLLFFELEINRLDDSALDAAMAQGALAHYRPWLEDIRKEKPHQLADDIEQLFLEKSVTGAGAWNRLFDETVASLRFEIEGEQLTLEPTLARLSDRDETKREAAAEGAGEDVRARTCAYSRSIMNTLAKDKEISDRWRKFSDIADSRHLANRVEREVVEALVQAVTESFPRLSHRYYALKARWFGKEKLAHWDRNAPLPNAPRAGSPGNRRATRCSAPMRASRRAWPTSRGASSTRAGSTRRCGPARRPAPSPIRRRRRRTPMCSSTISASRAT